MRGVMGDKKAKLSAPSRWGTRGLCFPRVPLCCRLVVCALVEEACAGSLSRESQGTGVVGDESPLEFRYVDRDGGSAAPGRGPIHDAPEEGGSVI